jgi:hypothetical protein
MGEGENEGITIVDHDDTYDVADSDDPSSSIVLMSSDSGNGIVENIPDMADAWEDC